MFTVLRITSWNWCGFFDGSSLGIKILLGLFFCQEQTRFLILSLLKTAWRQEPKCSESRSQRQITKLGWFFLKLKDSQGFSQVLKAWSWIACSCYSWAALLHTSGKLLWPVSVLRCNFSLLLLYALCKAMRWSLGHWGVTSDGYQEARCQDQLWHTRSGACWHGVVRLWAPPCNMQCQAGWHGVRGNPSLHKFTLLPGHLRLLASRGPCWTCNPGVAAAFSVPAQDGSPSATQGRTPLSCCPALVAHPAEAARSKQAVSFLLWV